MEIPTQVTLADTSPPRMGTEPAACRTWTPSCSGLAEPRDAILGPELGEDELSVGTGATIEHLGASRVGATLVATRPGTTRTGGARPSPSRSTTAPASSARVEHGRAIVARARILAALEGPT